MIERSVRISPGLSAAPASTAHSRPPDQPGDGPCAGVMRRCAGARPRLAELPSPAAQLCLVNARFRRHTCDQQPARLHVLRRLSLELIRKIPAFRPLHQTLLLLTRKPGMGVRRGRIRVERKRQSESQAELQIDAVGFGLVHVGIFGASQPAIGQRIVETDTIHGLTVRQVDPGSRVRQ